MHVPADNPEPDGHDVHAPVDAVQVVHVLQGKHVEAPAPECISVPQAAHAAVPPAENVPATHGVQVPEENPDPGGQVRQTPVDAVHVAHVLQAAHDAAPALECVSDEQATHVLLPPRDAVPAAHCVHVPPPPPIDE